MTLQEHEAILAKLRPPTPQNKLIATLIAIANAADQGQRFKKRESMRGLLGHISDRARYAVSKAEERNEL
jgi:hypothetical protein